jgi:ABC-type cobalamin/Fe3+-siderophores transport system ATPase subunit
MFKITIKNYRCFSETAPAIIEFSKGFTAFVGANNSGKSSLLRFFLEFRQLFNRLEQPQYYIPNTEINFNLTFVEDWTEIFNNTNQHDIIVEIINERANSGEISKIDLLIRREHSNSAKMCCWVNHGNEKFISVSRHSSTELNIGGNRIIPINSNAFESLANVIRNSLYVGPFRNAITEGSASYYDITVGTSFISQWDYWKTGASRSQNIAAQQVADDIAHIFEFQRFEINATPDKKSLQVIADGKPYRLRELGAGLAQFIIVFGNVANRKPALLLIDEPELNLHPSLQMDFLTSLASYTSFGVMFASHSVGLARSVSDRIYTFRKINGNGTVKPFDQTPNYAEFVGEMSFSSFKEIGCDRVLLVEGVTEAKAIQQFLRLMKKDHTTVLLPLGGSQMIRGGVTQELNELSRLSQNVSVLIDSERDTDGAPLIKEREEFIADCKKLGFKTHVTKLRAFENYFCESAIKAEKGPAFRALTPFEKLNDAPQRWAKSDNWRIARRMTLDEVKATDIGQFLDHI